MKGNNPNQWHNLGGKLTGRLALAAMGLWSLVLVSHTGLATRASLFMHYLEASHNAEGIAGKITLWERVIFSFILASS